MGYVKGSNVWVSISAVLALGLAPRLEAQTPPPQPNGPSCTSAAHRQFDFWVGQWDVYRSDTNALVAKSLVENLYDGCALRENWMPSSGTPGGSINVYRSTSGEWLQVWVDGANEVHEYRGRWTGKKIEFEGEARDSADVPRKVRMTFEPMADGSVVQTGYLVSDRGWAIEYQFIYRRARAG